jgi:D-aminopeptidase
MPAAAASSPRDRALRAVVAGAEAHGLRVSVPVALPDRSNLLVHMRPKPVVARVPTTGAVRPSAAWLAREVAVAAEAHRQAVVPVWAYARRARGRAADHLGSASVADSRATERRPGLRELGLRVGEFGAGPRNAITDVAGVAVGQFTVVRDEPAPPAERGVARTGVTAIVPGAPSSLLDAPVPAGAAVLNRAGEITGFLQVSEWGLLQTPVYLTATMAVGRVFDGAIAAAAAADPGVGNKGGRDPGRRRVRRQPAERRGPRAGRARRRRPGAGRGARRRGPRRTGRARRGRGGHRHRLLRLETRHRDVEPGRPRAWRDGRRARNRELPRGAAGPDRRRRGRARVGRGLRAASARGGKLHRPGATDVPLAPAQLTRVAHRAGLGLARTGSVAHHGSGEIFFAFAAAGGGGERGARTVSIRDAALDSVFASAVEATEGRCSMRCGGPRTCSDATVRS